MFTLLISTVSGPLTRGLFQVLDIPALLRLMVRLGLQ